MASPTLCFSDLFLEASKYLLDFPVSALNTHTYSYKCECYLIEMTIYSASKRIIFLEAPVFWAMVRVPDYALNTRFYVVLREGPLHPYRPPLFSKCS
mgnify:CR=1 FL=1